MPLDHEENVSAVMVDTTTSGWDLPEASLELESRGWTSARVDCAPKIAALASLVNLEPPEPVASVAYTSHGNLLVIAGDAPERAQRAAEALASSLAVTLLASSPLPAGRATAWTGRVESLSGFLGEFNAVIAELRAGEGGVRAQAAARFDLVLDFSTAALFAARQPPQGYFRAPADEAALRSVLDEIAGAVGEFEKPRYFAYRENICAHARSEITGCTACIDICSTQAIAADGNHVKVDPHLCMGCGACATVCPSGAMSYQFPRVADRGAQLKQLLNAYRHAGGTDACIVFHNGGDARALLARAASGGNDGLPARAIPIETWHVGAIGLDLLLPAIAFGAGQAIVLTTGSEDAAYRRALAEQMAIGEAILGALGYAGRRFALVEADTPAALDKAFAALEPLAGPKLPALFMLSNDKRTAIEFAVEHLVKHAPRTVEAIGLPAGAPFGAVHVSRDKCTMCMSCVGACPESALMDGVDQPLLKFLERNCVQCGLCVKTCPEDAITMEPRLLLTPQVREARVINETQPFNCIRCGKPFGTKTVVEAMLGRLAGHSMFAEAGALARLQMCGDCRVVDMMGSKNETTVFSLRDNG